MKKPVLLIAALLVCLFPLTTRAALAVAAPPPCLEVVVQNAEELRIAQDNGANRVELVLAPLKGGLTPAEATLKEVAGVARIPVMVMIRPTDRDFNYTEAEFAGMLKTLELLKSTPLPLMPGRKFGAVMGVQKADGSLDLARMQALAKAGAGLELVCHMAFDGSKDRLADTKALAGLGYARILTRGHNEPGNNIPNLEAQKTSAAGSIIIMPGVRIMAADVPGWVSKGFTQVHLGIGVRKDAKFTEPILPELVKQAASGLQK